MYRIAAVGLALALAAAAPADSKRRRGERLEDLMNPHLGPEYALWLAGPIARMASDEEIETFQSLTSDSGAQAFIDEFWRRRDPEPAYPRNPAREVFEQRAEEADRLFGEAGVPGRRTDRGSVYVLYGAPAEEEFEISPHPDDPPVLVWSYPSDAPVGLDGERPNGSYRFIKREELTTFYTPNPRPPRRRLGWPP